jgi:hypothetical protein
MHLSPGPWCFEQGVLSATPLACDKAESRQTCGSEDPRPQYQTPSGIGGGDSIIGLNCLGNVGAVREPPLLVTPCRQEVSGETMRTGCPRTQAPSIRHHHSLGGGRIR